MKSRVSFLFVSILLSVLFLTSCSSGTASPSQPSEYDEQKITLPNNSSVVFDLSYTADSRLIIATGNPSTPNIIVSQQSEEGAWETLFTTESLLGSLEEGMFVESAALSPAGDLLCSVVNSDRTKNSCYLINNDAIKKIPFLLDKIPLEKSQGDMTLYNSVGAFRFCDNDAVLIAETRGVLSKYSLSTGAKLFEVEVDAESGLLADYTISNDQLLASVAQINNDRVSFEFQAFDLQTGRKTSLDPDMEKSLNGLVAKDVSIQERAAIPPLLASNSSTIFICSNNVIYGCENNQVKDLFGQDTNLSNTNEVPGRLYAQDETGTLYVVYSSNSSSSLYRYVKSEDTTESKEDPPSKMTVYTLEDNPEIMQAIATFRDKRPDLSIELEVGIPIGSNISTDDALRSLNTRLLSNESPDVLVLDGLPVEQLSEQGMLVDLNDELSSLMENDSYFENVLTAFMRDEGCYAIPSRFTLPTLLGSEEFINNSNSLSDLVTYLNADEQTRSRLVPSRFISALYAADYMNIIPNGKSVDRAALKQFFEASKSLLDMAESGLAPEAKDAGYSVTNAALEEFDAISGSIGQSAQLFDGVYQFELGSIVEANDFGYLFLATENAFYPCDFSSLSFSPETVFVPNTILGIAAKSSCPADAKEFLSYVLSSETQLQSQGQGVPVCASAFEDALQKSDGGFVLSFMDDEGSHNYSTEALNDKKIASCKNLIGNAKIAAVFDKTVTDTIAMEFKNYCLGTSTLEQAVESAVQKINLYKAQ